MRVGLIDSIGFGFFLFFFSCWLFSREGSIVVAKLFIRKKKKEGKKKKKRI